MAALATEIDRRMALRGGLALLGTVALGSFGRSALAGEAQAATRDGPVNDGVEGLQAMHDYSVENQGIGIFINLQADAPKTGDELGQMVQAYLQRQGIASDYRWNQSRGTATDFTFYVAGVGYTYGLPQARQGMDQVVIDRFRGYQAGLRTLSMNR